MKKRHIIKLAAAICAIPGFAFAAGAGDWLKQNHKNFMLGMIVFGSLSMALIIWEVVSMIMSKKGAAGGIKVSIVEGAGGASDAGEGGSGEDPLRSLFQARTKIASDDDESVLPSFLDEKLDDSEMNSPFLTSGPSSGSATISPVVLSEPYKPSEPKIAAEQPSDSNSFLRQSSGSFVTKEIEIEPEQDVDLFKSSMSKSISEDAEQLKQSARPLKIVDVSPPPPAGGIKIAPVITPPASLSISSSEPETEVITPPPLPLPSLHKPQVPAAGVPAAPPATPPAAPPLQDDTPGEVDSGTLGKKKISLASVSPSESGSTRLAPIPPSPSIKLRHGSGSTAQPPASGGGKLFSRLSDSVEINREPTPSVSPFRKPQTPDNDKKNNEEDVNIKVHIDGEKRLSAPINPVTTAPAEEKKLPVRNPSSHNDETGAIHVNVTQVAAAPTQLANQPGPKLAGTGMSFSSSQQADKSSGTGLSGKKKVLSLEVPVKGKVIEDHDRPVPDASQPKLKPPSPAVPKIALQNPGEKDKAPTSGFRTLKLRNPENPK